MPKVSLSAFCTRYAWKRYSSVGRVVDLWWRGSVSDDGYDYASFRVAIGRLLAGQRLTTCSKRSLACRMVSLRNRYSTAELRQFYVLRTHENSVVYRVHLTWQGADDWNFVL